ncbi:MAG: PEGA domain-containing protein [Vicinamibacterales bacterium]
MLVRTDGLSRPVRAFAPGTDLGVLVVSSNPPLATVFIDGRPQGNTPVALFLPGGKYEVSVSTGLVSSEVATVNIKASTQAARHFDLPAGGAGPTASAPGRLTVDSEPSGSAVLLDGRSVGATPLVLEAVPPGRHAIVVNAPAGQIQREVAIEAGASASLLVTAPPSKRSGPAR